MRQGTVLEAYTKSWQNHDLTELTNLFAPEFEYKINGEIRFRTIKELRSYWAKNAFRQLNLKIVTQFEHSITNGEGADFFAHFYDPIRLSQNTIAGRINIYLDDKGKIINVVEHYKKSEQRQILYSLETAHQVILQTPIASVASVLKIVFSFLKSLTRYGLLGLFLLGVFTLVYVNYIHPHAKLFSDEAVDAVRPAIPFFFAALYILNQILPLFRSTAADIEVEKFSNKDDLKIMQREIAGADRVSILSGDFSFLSDDPELEQTLRALAFSGKLELFSYKSRAAVEAQVRNSSASNQIYTKLSDDGKIYFGSKISAKCTIAEFGNVKKLLFRFSKDKASIRELHMGIVRRKENNQYLIEVVDRIFSSMRA